MLFFKYTLISLFILCNAILASSQYQNLKFEHITTDEGLSQSTVVAILQDSKGFMWFGTRDGLNKYDGYTFTVFKNILNDTTSLSSNIIRDIIEDRNKNIWIATWGGGLNKFDPKTEKFTRYTYNKRNANGISTNFINSLLEDSEGNIVIGTRNRGLDIYDPKSGVFHHYTHIPTDTSSISGAEVRAIYEDSNKNLWIGTANDGLNLFDKENQSLKRIKHDPRLPNSLSGDSIRFILEDKKNRLWIGTYGGGLNLYLGSGKFQHFKKADNDQNSLSHDFLVSASEDNAGNLWIGTENNGLSIFNFENNQFFSYANSEIDPYSINSNSVNSIFQDNKGNMWLGTFTGGINLFNIDAHKFTHIKKNSSRESLSNNNIQCFYEDGDDVIYIGTDGGGINIYDCKTGSFEYISHKPGLAKSISGNHVTSICKDAKGNLWAGTWKDGVTVFNPKEDSYKFYKNIPGNPSSIGSNNAWEILQDNNGNIWIGTYGGGLALYDASRDSFKNYKYQPNNPNSISSNMVISVLEDKEGKLWIGTEGAGLNWFDPKEEKFIRFEHEPGGNSISSNDIRGIHEDKNGDIWIGTNSGLNHYNKKTGQFTVYRSSDGLPNDVVMGILEDEKGFLWMSTNKGLSRFDPIKKHFKNYTVADGLQANEFKDKAYLKSRKGEMYFGGKNGFNVFLPDSIEDKPYSPPLIITSFLVYNKPVAFNEPETNHILTGPISEVKEISIPYKYSVISFEFSSINFTAPEKKLYAYRLAGFDKDWNEVGVKRTATYTNLDPGEYLFEVKGLDNEGNWATDTAQIKLTIVPPFWKTWWFRTFLVICFISSFVAFYKARTRMILNKKEELEALVCQRTEELKKQSKEIERINAMLQEYNKQLEHEVEDITKARVMQKILTFGEFRQIFPNDDACYQYVADLKWANGFTCKKCFNTNFSPWKTPYSKRCTRCNYIESPTAFTLFHSLKFSILKAFYLLFLVHEDKGITSEELSKIVSISSKTCKVFKRKILDVIAEKKLKKKNSSWDDVILLESKVQSAGSSKL